MRRASLSVALAALLFSAPAAASDRAKATAAAVVPGVLVHGSGHWVAGQRQTARTLLYTELVGLGAAGTGGAVLYFTGASRRLVAPAASLAIFGLGLFVVSWLADIEGAAAPPLGEPRRALPRIESSLGLRFVEDSAFPYGAFVTTGLDLRVGRVRVSPEGWFSAGHPNQRLRLGAAYRFFGATTKRARDGSFLDLEAAGARHAFPPERFTMTSGEIAIAGRLDLARIAPGLRGSFVDGSLGYGLARHTYALRGAPDEGHDQLLARWAYGVWLGRPTSTWAEVSAFYEHRHDGYAGGLKVPGLFSGVLGSFGARALAWLTDDLGVVADVQVGSAVVAGASILVRQPVTP